MIGSLETLLAAVEGLPAVRAERDDAAGSAGVRVGARIVARIDLRHGDVVVHAPADTIPTLQRVFPSARPTADGIAFHVAESKGWAEALEAIRRRVNVERLIWQARVTSP